MTSRRAGNARPVTVSGPRRDRGRLREAWDRPWFRRSALTIGVAGALLTIVTGIAYAAVSLPKDPQSAQTTVVLDAEDNVLGELFKVQNRVSVKLDQVAPIMRKSVIAAEDRGFYSHGGIDPIGLGRALFNDLRGRKLQGGSTITQQLVKNSYLTPERSLTRKAKEAILAVKVERQYSKDEILERYLNTVYFGRGAYGVEQASQIWFGVKAKDLTLPQAAFLAGLVRSPETADPTTHPAIATKRRQIVLHALVKTRKISAAAAAAAEAVPIQVAARANPDDRLSGSTAYFVAQVRKWLIDRYGEALAFGGGLRVQTTLRPKMQLAAEKAVFGTLDRPDDPDAALVALDDRGAIVAMIGGRDFKTSNVNLAMGTRGGGQGRQPGSTFKPFVLAAALTSGIPVTQEYQGPSHLVVDVNGQPFDVTNFNNETFGAIDLQKATEHSVNTVFAQLIRDVGPKVVADLANQVGVTAKLDAYPALALGSEEVAPIDMASAYMTFANRGDRTTPYSVEKVRNTNGAVIYSASMSRKNVYPRQYADVVNHVLRGVMTSGTGRAAQISHQAAGKTGTTSSNTDAWFVGYTPKLGAAVWMGYKEGTKHKMTSVHGRRVTGGTFPAQIWKRFMAAATAGMDTGTFVEPDAELLKPKPDDTSSTTSSTTTSITVPDGAVPTTTTTTPGGGGSTSTSTSTTTATDRKRTTTTTTTTYTTATTTTTPP